MKQFYAIFVLLQLYSYRVVDVLGCTKELWGVWFVCGGVFWSFVWNKKRNKWKRQQFKFITRPICIATALWSLHARGTQLNREAIRIWLSFKNWLGLFCKDHSPPHPGLRHSDFDPELHMSRTHLYFFRWKTICCPDSSWEHKKEHLRRRRNWTKNSRNGHVPTKTNANQTQRLLLHKATNTWCDKRPQEDNKTKLSRRTAPNE